MQRDGVCEHADAGRGCRISKRRRSRGERVVAEGRRRRAAGDFPPVHISDRRRVFNARGEGLYRRCEGCRRYRQSHLNQIGQRRFRHRRQRPVEVPAPLHLQEGSR